MTVLPILAVGIMMGLVAVLWVLVSIVLILVILIQKGRGGGLSAAFGGGMGGGLLGSKTGDFLTWVTIVLVAIFLTLAVLMARFFKPSHSKDYDAAPATTEQPVEGESSDDTGQTATTPETGAPDAGPAEQETTPEVPAPAVEEDVPTPAVGAGGDANSPG